MIPGGSEVKESACNVETWVQSLGREGLLEKEMASYPSILAWKMPWTEEATVHGVANSQT